MVSAYKQKPLAALKDRFYKKKRSSRITTLLSFRQKYLIPFDCTISTGVLTLTEWPLDHSPVRDISYYEAMNIAGSFHARISQSDFPGSLLEIQWTTNEEFRLSNFFQPFSLFCLLQNSLEIEVSGRGSQIVHERGGQMISLENQELILHVRKDISYRLVLIPVSIGLLSESAESSNILNDYHQTWSSSPFFYPRSCVTDKNGLELMSLLFFGKFPAFAKDEIARALVRWFLQTPYDGKFQPDHLSIDDAHWFYDQKLKLIALALKPIPLQKLIVFSGLQNKELFKIRLKQIFGLSVRQLILESRMAAATEFLKNPNLTIKQIAGSCGFRGVNYFTRVFSHYFGISPNAFRKLI